VSWCRSYNLGRSNTGRFPYRSPPLLLQVASYPFTTLRPQLGTVVFSDGRALTVADIPGLIEGAHANRCAEASSLRRCVMAVPLHPCSC
jgi:50S ribosome-binding GTPase